MKYQASHMWRLQMNNYVPEVMAGLRSLRPDGTLGRSPYVAVFQRIPNSQAIRLRFLELDSAEFAALRRRAIKSGMLGRTRARQYGWCN